MGYMNDRLSAVHDSRTRVVSLPYWTAHWCCRQQLKGSLYCGAHLQVAADPGGSSALMLLLQQLA